MHSDLAVDAARYACPCLSRQGRGSTSRRSSPLTVSNPVALFIAPYIQLVFGIEIALRGLRKKPFQPRRKWDVTICMTIVGLLTLTSFLVADFDRTIDFCFTSLFFFLAHYSTGCFATLTAIASVLLICTVIIFVRLHRSIKIEVTERVVASRMVYYLALAVISNVS